MSAMNFVEISKCDKFTDSYGVACNEIDFYDAIEWSEQSSSSKRIVDG